MVTGTFQSIVGSGRAPLVGKKRPAQNPGCRREWTKLMRASEEVQSDRRRKHLSISGIHLSISGVWEQGFCRDGAKADRRMRRAESAGPIGVTGHTVASQAGGPVELGMGAGRQMEARGQLGNRARACAGGAGRAGVARWRAGHADAEVLETRRPVSAFVAPSPSGRAVAVHAQVRAAVPRGQPVALRLGTSGRRYWACRHARRCAEPCKAQGMTNCYGSCSFPFAKI